MTVSVDSLEYLVNIQLDIFRIDFTIRSEAQGINTTDIILDIACEIYKKYALEEFINRIPKLFELHNRITDNLDNDMFIITGLLPRKFTNFRIFLMNALPHNTFDSISICVVPPDNIYCKLPIFETALMKNNNVICDKTIQPYRTDEVFRINEDEIIKHIKFISSQLELQNEYIEDTNQYDNIDYYDKLDILDTCYIQLLKYLDLTIYKIELCNYQDKNHIKIINLILNDFDIYIDTNLIADKTVVFNIKLIKDNQSIYIYDLGYYKRSDLPLRQQLVYKNPYFGTIKKLVYEIKRIYIFINIV